MTKPLPTTTTSPSPPDYYAILSLTTRKNDPTLSPSEVKTAYKRALLTHHPDKTKTATNPITIDAIALSYQILSSPSLKSAYDLALLTSKPSDEEKVFRTGLETVDLDDLSFDEGREVWSRGCRCGDEGGFVVTEGELEDGEEEGEVIVGCRGCSLWLRVLFGVEEDGGDGVSLAT
jgi:diphthamide biosynthesis protein 4